MLSGFSAKSESTSVQNLGEELSRSIIWSTHFETKTVAFRKTFFIPAPFENKLSEAKLHLFADTKYMLYLNGQYVARGPCRFDPKSPEFDTLPVGKFLKPGKNTFAILVYGHVDGSGDAMEHDPGLTLKLQVGDYSLKTDRTWKVSEKTRYQNPLVTWDGIRENIRADLEKSDWLEPSFQDQDWKHPVIQEKNDWGKFRPRITPLLSETEVSFQPSQPLPALVSMGQELKLALKKNIMGYVRLKFFAESGSKINVFGHHYTARAGLQEYISADIYGSGAHGILDHDEAFDDVADVAIHVKIESGKVRFNEVHVVQAVAPLVQVGEFHSSDSMLNRFFEVMTNMHQQITQDTYTDGGSEGNEWMGDVYNIFHFTRVAFAGKNTDGSLNFTDRTHLKKALLDIAVSQQPDGRVKAHHPSDRNDEHWFIEDFSAYWVMSIRNYYEMTGDRSVADETWGAVKKQMKWFMDQQISSGLIHGREWMIFDNPYAYQRGEGATLNALSYKAFMDAAYLAKLEKDEVSFREYIHVAKKIKSAFNERLWNEAVGSFNGMPKKEPTTHAAVMSLYTGICDSSRRESVQKWLLARTQDKIVYPLIHFFWFKDLYDMNSSLADQQVLDVIRAQYGNAWNAYNPGFITSEMNNGGRTFHNFGMVPGSYLSQYVLGVRTEGKIRDRKVLIEPRLGDLEFASGKVATENGVVSVSWKKIKSQAHSLQFSFLIPKELTARVGIPFEGTPRNLKMNDQLLIENGVVKSQNVQIKGRFVYVEGIEAGEYQGRVW